MSDDSRPVNLSLWRFHFPITAVVSILHRISGLALFGLLLPMIYLVHLGSQSESGFERMLGYADMPLARLGLAVFLSSLVYHALAGLRHLVMDLGFWEHLDSGRRSAWAVVIVAVAAAGFFFGRLLL
ncbi:MAG: succinate dehydrogenase, cytochrome b556 subunit [Gammaproteobacteria bacterium AqS3]|nr:succinate dehydrogenase, cytochrome b556 subunit [Gammaproteobacteria bacterium AqS3]